MTADEARLRLAGLVVLCVTTVTAFVCLTVVAVVTDRSLAEPGAAAIGFALLLSVLAGAESWRGSGGRRMIRRPNEGDE